MFAEGHGSVAYKYIGALFTLQVKTQNKIWTDSIEKPLATILGMFQSQRNLEAMMRCSSKAFLLH